MEFTRLTAEFGKVVSAGGGGLCAGLRLQAWLVEAGCLPPPAHRPERLLAGRHCQAAAAISISTTTVLGDALGQALISWLESARCKVAPLAGLAVHELLLNAAIHGNLEIESGPSTNWCDLSAREGMIAAALQDVKRSARVLTVAVGWDARAAAVVIADQGAGYREPPQDSTTAGERRGAGKGLKIARLTGQMDVRDGGRCATLLLDRVSAAEVPAACRPVQESPTPIIVLDPDAQEARRLADWLRSAGLGTILTARTARRRFSCLVANRSAC